MRPRVLTPEESSAADRYRSSRAWRERRERSLELAANRCQECGADRYQAGVLFVHHLTYERFGAELDADLQVLCRDCHNEAHFDPSDDDWPELEAITAEGAAPTTPPSTPKPRHPMEGKRACDAWSP